MACLKEDEFYLPSGHSIIPDNTLFDDADLSNPSIEGNTSYAWGNLAWKIIAKRYGNAIENTDGTFTVVDTCSGLPYFAECLRERHRRECLKQAVSMVEEGVMGEHLLTLDSLDPSTRKDLTTGLVSLEPRIGRLLIGAIHKLLYDPPGGLLTTTEQDQVILTRELLRTFRRSTTTFYYLNNLDEYPFTIMPLKLRDEVLLPNTLESSLNSLIGENPAKSLMQEIASYFGTACLPLIRRFNVVSLDIDNPKDLVEGGGQSFPAEIRNTDLYQQARNFQAGSHLQASVLSLPFAANSISVLTNIEGYPWFFAGLPLQNHIDLAADIASVLKPGGFAGFFPFTALKGADTDGFGLALFCYELEKRGLLLYETKYPKEFLFKQLGSRERVLANYSPLFKETPTDTLSALFAQKPK